MADSPTGPEGDDPEDMMMEQDDLGEEEEDEFDDEEPSDVVRNFGQHPMMENIQKALFSQLEREHERVMLEKREKSAVLDQLTSKRENVGVDLYSNQQQLARLQLALENLHNNYHTLRDARNQEETVLEEAKSRCVCVCVCACVCV